MTAQVPDYVVLEGLDYSIAGVSGGDLLQLERLGIETGAISSACWRGSVCWYTIDHGSLAVCRLLIGSGSRRDGVELQQGDDLLGGRLEKPSERFWHGTLEVKNIALPLDFSGGLLVGRDFVRSTYVHMGFHPAWKYAVVFEVLLEGGSVSSVEDKSADVASLRDRILIGETSDPDGERTHDRTAWVDRTFRLDYSRSGL